MKLAENRSARSHAHGRRHSRAKPDEGDRQDERYDGVRGADQEALDQGRRIQGRTMGGDQCVARGPEVPNRTRGMPDQSAEADAVLTNGADVTVTESPGGCSGNSRDGPTGSWSVTRR
jgi:hypothetical protein